MTDRLRRLVAACLAGAIGLGSVPPASAHAGTVHAGTPHWILLGVLVLGVGVLGGSLALGRRGVATRLVLGGAFVGGVLVVVGTVGLTEIQVEPLATNATPFPRSWYPLIALAAGGAILLASLNLGLWRWPHRPEYTALGAVLGLWILYPVVFAAQEYHHPLGYALVLSVPLLVGYILWKDVRPALAEATRRARWVGVGTTLLFVVFLLFSTGQFTLNPETLVNNPDEQFVVVTAFASPLVLWPAVEFYYPTVPLFGALSVGTGIAFTLLAGLVGSNAVLATTAWQSDVSVDDSRGVLGGLATTGATACCCCAPAFYGVISAVLGISASPLYWTFLDPNSPLGTIFFVGAIVLMTGNTVRLSRGLGEAGVCPVPGVESPAESADV